MTKSDIAFGSEFSPKQVDLGEVLEMVEGCAGNRETLLNAVRKRWFPKAVVAKNPAVAGARVEITPGWFIKNGPENPDRGGVEDEG